jgi:hypothetical protein
VLYYNPNKGQYYHRSDFCYSARKVTFQPFTYGQLEEEPFAGLEPCPYCVPPIRESAIAAINEAYAFGGDHDELLTSLRAGYYEYLEENGTAINSEKMKPCRALNALLGECGKKRSDIIAKSCIEKHYAYQIFNGAKIPSRDKMIMLCIAFGLDFERTSELFKVTGYPPLYARDLRDNIIIYCLENKLGVIKANLYLSEKNLPILD